MTKILIPVEDPKFGEAQIDFLSKHELPADTEFMLLNIITPLAIQDYGFAVPSSYLEAIAVEDDKRSKNLLDSTAAKLAKAFPKAKIQKRTALGAAAAEILHEAKEESYDWIILGSHGRSGWDKFLLGSVSQAVVNRAHCSVTVVRIPPEKHEETESGKEKSAATC